ncbi:polymorphic toxin-type HINT domain-containing protein [Tumebacillus sp. DT12]|uniref:Polymorphic toxin-type HINT domain-containing protein n=1 Tax=Tumebacillus lacus TaxID=2995335 RepID=A0ABT3X396_9BACL|nr:polymorphic toxin-type HINT domain-containing protein [Tumebacillus lacus]MCX7571379.1 polymorphic toxin-type HINT domain-containing protein [Tumebacillus lacus]
MRLSGMYAKVLAWTLVLSLALGYPLESLGTAYAHGTNEHKDKEDPKKEAPDKVLEIKEKRTENSKTWKNSDLTETIEMFSTPIFYQDPGQKEWKEIDNSLTEEIKDKEEQGNFKYRNKANKFTALFGKTADKDIFKIKQGQHALSYSVVGAKAAEGVSKEDALTYSEILANIDAVYHVRSTGVKEDLVLKKLPEVDRITFELKTDLNVKKEGRRIVFTDKKDGSAVWAFDPPFLRDSSDRESHEMDFVLEEKGGKVLLTLPLDMNYLKDPETTYPVLLDPTVTVGGTTATTFDAYVGEVYGHVNYGGDPELRTGYAPTVDSHRTYIKFGSSLPSLDGGLLTGANFKAYKYYEPSSVDTTINIHRAYSAWSSSSITYDTQPGFGGTYASNTLSKGEANGWYTWNVGNLVNYWYDNPANYHGLVMQASNENTTGSYRKFYSSDYSSGAYAPRLEITYSPKPAAPTGTAYGNGTNTGNGYVNLQWSAVAGATGYKVLFFNGKAYEEIDVGNTLSWTTKGKKLWPTAAQVAAGTYTLRLDGSGGELEDDPRPVYQASGGNYPNSKNYWFRVKAYNAYGATVQSDAFMPTIEDETAPTKPGTPAVSNKLNSSYTFTWGASTDSLSGVKHYEVYLGTQSGVWDVVNGATTTGTTYTYSGELVPRTPYYMAVKAVDNNGNYTWSTTSSDTPRKALDASIVSYSIPATMEASGDYNVQVTMKNEGLQTWTSSGAFYLGSVAETDPLTQDTRVPLASTDSIGPAQTKTFNLRFNGGKNPGDFLTQWGMLQVGVGRFGDTLTSNVKVADTTPPQGAIVINNGQTLTNSPNVTLNLSVTDNANGPYQQRLRNEQLAWSADEAFTAVKQWTLSEGNGDKTVSVVYKDASGNESAIQTDGIILDTTFPTAEMTSPNERDYLNGTVDIAGSATDNDLQEYTLSYGAGTTPTQWTEIAKKTEVVDQNVLASWNTAGIPTGLYTLRLEAKDKAGNVSVVSKYVYVDQFLNMLGTETFWGVVDTPTGFGTSKVNLSNGNLFLTYQDFDWDGRGLNAGINRSYNSQDTESGLLGQGWRLDVESKLIAESNGDLTHVEEDGSRHRFVKNEDGTYTPPTGIYVKLTKQADGTYLLQDQDADAISSTFNAQGLLTSEFDTNENKITYVWANNQLQEIVDAVGRKVTFAYMNNVMTEVNSPIGKIKYFYTDLRLTSVEFYDAAGTLYRTLGYAYDDKGRLKSTTDPNQRVVNYRYNGLRLINVENSLTTLNASTGQLNPPVTVAQTFGYDLVNKKVDMTIAGPNDSLEAEYGYNEVGNVVSMTEDPNGLNLTKSFVYQNHLLMESTDPRFLKTTFTYDALGNVLTKTEPTTTDLDGGQATPVHSTKYKTGTSLVEEEIDPLGRVTKHEYDARGNKTATIDPDGFKVTFTYDAYGNVTEETHQRGALYGYLPNHSFEKGDAAALNQWKTSGSWSFHATEKRSGVQGVALTGTASIESDYVPIKEGRLPVRALGNVKANGATGLVSSLQFYDSSKNLISSASSAAINGTVDWSIQHVFAPIPANAAFVTAKISLSAGTVYTDDIWMEEADYKLITKYDANGLNPIESFDPYGKKTTNEFDLAGNMTKETNELGQSATWIYNADGEAVEETDRLGKKTVHQYDGSGNLIKTTNALGHSIEYLFDEANRQIQIKNPHVTKQYYDNQTPREAEVVSITNIDEYNELGFIVAEKDGNGSISRYEYDKAGRMVRSVDPLRNEMRITYDANDNKLTEENLAWDTVTSTLHSKGVTHYRYDEQNRQISESDPTKDANTLVEQQKFDVIGRLLKEVDGMGLATNYGYDIDDNSIYSKDSSTPAVETWALYDGKGNQAISMDKLGAVTNIHDLNGLLKEVVDAEGKKTVYTYNAAGDKTKLVDATGAVTDWEYDAEGQLSKETKSIKDPVTGETKLQITLYEYDALGQVVKRTMQEGIGTSVTTTNEVTLSYDELGQLVRELGITQPAGTQTNSRYYHDNNGNVTNTWIYDETNPIPLDKDPDGDGFYNSQTISVYDKNNRLLEETITHTQTVTKTAYDDKNNKEIITNALGDTVINSDDSDRTKQILTPNFDTFDYDYYVNDMVSKVTAPGVQTTFTYNGGEKVSTIKANNRNNNAPVLDLQYRYTDTDQIAEISDKGVVKGRYTYSSVGNLETAEENGRKLKYTYDGNSNIVKVEDLATGKTVATYTYATGDRVQQKKEFDKTTGALVRTTDYEFNPSGTLKKVKTTEGTNVTVIDYGYNSDDQLMTVDKTINGAVQPKVFYEYDTEGNRIAKNVSDAAGNTHYHYHRDTTGGIFLETKLTATSKTEALKYYRDGDGNLLSFSLNDVVYYYQFNARGDVLAITDSAGNVVTTYEYDTWGNVISIGGDKALGEANPYRFVGKLGVIYDQDTNLYLMGWRDYDSSTGRFIVPDEYEGEEDEPVSLNRYLYADADPVNNIDPDGHKAKWLSGVWKSTKKAAKKAYNFAVGDDIRTLKSKKSKWYHKAGAAASIASNFVPGAGQAKWAVKGAIKGVKAGKKAIKSVKYYKPSVKKARVKKTKVVLKKSKAPQRKTYRKATPQKDCKCFTVGTTVHTEDGEKPIESVEIGDKVLAKDEVSGEKAYKEVEWLFEREVDEIYEVHVGAEVLKTTDEHPFWVVGEGWVETKDLKAGDRFETAEGKILTIDSIYVNHKKTTVYNFKVKDYHTYFVSNLGIWTHNACTLKPRKKSSTKSSNTAKVRPQKKAKTKASLYQVVPYRPTNTPLENHHGVLDVWAKHNIANYKSRATHTPAIALTKALHDATKAVTRDWMEINTGKRVGGKIGWKNIHPREMQALTEAMFDAAKVPESSRREYYRALHKYIYR